MKKINNFIPYAFISIAVFFFFFSVAYGQINATPPTNTQTITLSNPFKCGSTNCDLMSLIAAILNNIVMPIAGVAAVVFIILAGFKYVTAQGKPADIAAANKNLLWALIGTGVLLGAAGISQVIQSTISSLLN